MLNNLFVYKKVFNQSSLHYKMLAITLLTTLTSLIIAYIIFIALELFSQYKDAKQQLAVSGQTISTNIHSALVFNDREFAYQVLQSLKIQEKIEGAELYSNDGNVLAKYQHKKNLHSELNHTDYKEGISRLGTKLTYKEKLYLDGELLGTLIIHFDLLTYFEQIVWKALILFFIFIFSSALAYIVWSKLQTAVTRPINLLLDSITQVTKQHDYSIYVNKHSEDELGQLIDGFNEMLSQIQNRDRLLEEHSRQLESHVIKRTHDLMQEKINAEAANRSKSEFIATISHEIRTPMNAILGFSYLTLQTQLNPQQQENINNINQAAQSLLSIINDILDFSKMDVGKMKIDNIAFDINKLTAQISNTMKTSAEQKNLKFTINLPPQTPQYLIGDPNRLQQVLINLIGNAIKFTHKGKVKLTIAPLEINSKQVTLIFNVSDTGIGISKQQQQSLFQLFSQVDSSITRKFGGTGLGLAISQRLVKLMGGKISINSAKNKGTTFFFSLTFDRADLQQLIHTRNSFNKADIPTDLKGCHILIVEDQLINQQVVKAILEQAGIIVTLASNGLEAVNLIKNKKQIYQVILMDLQMPEMSGYEAADYIRNTLKESELPIIAMTANVLAGDQKQLNSASMNDYIPKPINPNQMFKILKKWIRPPCADELNPGNNISLEKPRIECNQKSSFPSTLPGINIKRGLELVNGNQKLYRSLLLQFLNDKKNIFNDLAQAFVNHQMQECKQISHSIKGLAGNLAAEDLYIQAKYLDNEFTNNNYNPQALAGFERAFNKLMNSLKELDKFSLSTQQTIPSAINNYQELKKQLEKFKLLLMEGNFKVVNSLQDIECLFDNNHLTLYKQLEEQTMSFNFNSALETLNNIETSIQKLDEIQKNG
ncbi:MAG: ATP-binding protein [Pseudomonadota bacterium]